MVNLTPKQEKFVQGLISGLSQREAFKQAYNCSNMKDTTIDARACKLLKEYKVSTRYDELMEEHKNKALWTREDSINDLKWLKEQAKSDILTIGLKQANSNAFLSAVKELNELEDLYPKKIKEELQQEKNVAEEIRGLINGINSKAN